MNLSVYLPSSLMNLSVYLQLSNESICLPTHLSIYLPTHLHTHIYYPSPSGNRHDGDVVQLDGVAPGLHEGVELEELG